MPRRTLSRYHALDPGNVLLGARHLRRSGALLRRHLRQTPHRRREGADVRRVEDLVPPLRGQRPGDAGQLRRLRNVLGATCWIDVVGGAPHARPTASATSSRAFPGPKEIPPLAWKLLAPVFNPLVAFLTTGGLPPQSRKLLDLPGQTPRSAATSASPRSGGRAGQLDLGSAADVVALQRICARRICPRRVTP